VTLSDRYGSQIEHWNGMDVGASPAAARVLLQGGLSTGRTSTDNCDVVTRLDNPSPLYCHVDTKFLTQVKFLGSYTIPRVQVQISGTFQSIPGPDIAANYLATNAVVSPSLGRNLAGNAPNVTVNLVSPGTMYGERLNQLDLRFSKVLTFARTRTNLHLDLNNALNGNASSRRTTITRAGRPTIPRRAWRRSACSWTLIRRCLLTLHGGLSILAPLWNDLLWHQTWALVHGRMGMNRVFLPRRRLCAAPIRRLVQAVITGVVGTAGRGAAGRDRRGVERRGRKSRSVVTDGTGQYRVIDLRPGLYAVTFTLSGFSIVRREGIELAGSFTAIVNADLKIGTVQETITVTGETPIVDVQSVTKQRVLNQEIIEAIPTGRNQYNLGVLIPGVTTNSLNQQDVGGSAGLDAAFAIVVHGSQPDSQRITQNGITLGTILGGGYGGGAVPNASAVQEWTFDYSGVSAELATGGVRINFIPKEGGNSFRGVVFGSFSNNSLQGSNFSQDLKDRGLLYPNLMKRVWDVNPGFGGPIARDRLWFYASVRTNGAWNFVPGMVYNRNANNPNA
jgi:hypothetical protein